MSSASRLVFKGCYKLLKIKFFDPSQTISSQGTNRKTCQLANQPGIPANSFIFLFLKKTKNKKNYKVCTELLLQRSNIKRTRQIYSHYNWLQYDNISHDVHNKNRTLLLELHSWIMVVMRSVASSGGGAASSASQHNTKKQHAIN